MQNDLKKDTQNDHKETTSSFYSCKVHLTYEINCENVQFIIAKKQDLKFDFSNLPHWL